MINWFAITNSGGFYQPSEALCLGEGAMVKGNRWRARVESNYTVSTHEVFVAGFALKLMNVRKVNYTVSVVNNMGRLVDLYHDL